MNKIKNMKKQLLLLAMILLPMVASADAVEINGIYYNVVSKTNEAEVTNNPNRYTGSVVIPERVTYGGKEYSVTRIGSYAFSDCYGLTSVSIPNSVTSIGERAFNNSYSLISLTIPNSVTSIENYAFAVCSGLTSVNISNSVTTIGSHVFSCCTSLTSVNIPNNVTTIGECAFYGCTGLTSVTIPNSVTNIGMYAFDTCSGLTSLTIGNSVTSIGNWAFQNCFGLTSVTIPNNVTIIGYWAFYNCSGLTSVTIGSGIRTICGQAFANCKNIKDLYCYSEKVPSTDTNAFENSYINGSTLHVPDASINAYKQAEPWKNFKFILGLNGTTPAQKCETPTISYGGKKLTFSCDTEGVEYVYEIKDSDIKKGYESEIQLTATYEISVYATKQGYEDSDVATATLVWGSASFTETTGTTSASPLAYDTPVLIQSNGGQLTIQGVDDGTQVSIYNINGTEAGKAISKNGCASVSTNLQAGSVAIIKIGEKSVKVVVK